MKKLILILLLATPLLADTTGEYFFNFDKPWNWAMGQTAYPYWPLYDSLSAVAGITENANAAWDRPWRHRIDYSQFVSGTASMASEFRGDEISGGNPNRAEVVRYSLGAFRTGVERWYGFSLYLTEDWRPLFSTGGSLDPNGSVAFQCHSIGSGHPPSVYLEIRDSTRQYSITVDYNSSTTATLPATRTRYEIGDWRADIGKWTDWVVHANFACDGTDSGGVTQVWKDGKLLVNVTGGNCYNDADEHFFRFGAYKSWWGSNPPPAGRNLRILHDSVRIGNSTRNFEWTKPKRALARNYDTPWITAGVVKDGRVPIYAGVPRRTINYRAGELWRGR